MGQLLTTSQIAVLVGVAASTIRQWARSGRMPPPVGKAGGSFRFRAGDIEDWAEAGFPAEQGGVVMEGAQEWPGR